MKSLTVVFFTIISCGLGIIGCSGSPIDPWNNNNVINNNQNKIENDYIIFNVIGPEIAKVFLVGPFTSDDKPLGERILGIGENKIPARKGWPYDFYIIKPVPNLVPQGRVSCFDDNRFNDERFGGKVKIQKDTPYELKLEVDPHANSVDVNFLGKYYAEFFNGLPKTSPAVPGIYCKNGRLYLTFVCGFGWEVIGHNNKLVSKTDPDKDWVATATYEYNSEFERWEIFVKSQTKKIDPNTKKPIEEDDYSCRSYIIH